MPERRKKKKGASSVAASAVATVTAAGVLVGGAYSSPEELMNDGPAPVVDTLINNDVPANDGGLGPEDFEEELAGAEDEEKRGGVRASVRRRMRAAPAGVRAMIGVPLWIIGTIALMALSTLWTGVLSPAAMLVLSWVGIALLAVLIYTLAVKAVFPDMPLKKILNKRSIIGIGILCLIFGVADAALPLFWDDYLALSRIVKLVGSMICTGVPVIWFLRRRKREEPEEIVAEVVEEPEPEPEPTMEEKEAAARKLVQELADSVSRKI